MYVLSRNRDTTKYYPQLSINIIERLHMTLIGIRYGRLFVKFTLTLSLGLGTSTFLNYYCNN